MSLNFEFKSGIVPTWPRLLALRGPRTKIYLITLTFLILLYHFRVWDASRSLKLSPSMGVYIQHPADAAPVLLLDTSQPPGPPPEPPIPEPVGIPKKMWFKLGPKGLGSDARVWTASCIDQNPGYDVQFLTDESAAGFVNESFAHRPDIVDTYNALTVPILKADLLRYLLLYAEGGVWFDLDASCEGIPIDDWIPPELEERADLVVGWEFDAGYRFQFRQFTTWAVLSRRGVSHLMAVVDDIVDAVHEAARAHNTTVSMLDKNMVGDVVDFTGPIRFAQSVMKSIDRSTNMAYKWDDYHGLLEPKLAGNILILPGYSFAASCNTYEPRDQHRIRPPLVEHHYAGTWKNDYGGERIE